MDHPLGVIYLKSNAFLNKTAEISESVGYGFTIRAGSKRFLLAAETNDEKSTWLRLIDKVITNCVSREKVAMSRKRSQIITGNNQPEIPSTSPTNSPSSSPFSNNTNNFTNGALPDNGVSVVNVTSSYDREKIEKLQKQKDETLNVLQQIDSTFLKLLSTINNVKQGLNGTENKDISSKEKAKSKQKSEKKKPQSSDDSEGNLTEDDFDSSDEDDGAEGFQKTNFDPTAIIAPSTVSDLMNPVERLKGLKASIEKLVLEVESVNTSITHNKSTDIEHAKELEHALQDYEQENDDLKKRIQELETENEELGHHKKLLIKEVKKLRSETSTPTEK